MFNKVQVVEFVFMSYKVLTDQNNFKNNIIKNYYITIIKKVIRLKMNKTMLDNLINEISISPEIAKDIKDRYERLGDWLIREDSLIAEYEPDFYSQGSIRLGTAIKPISQESDYDLDSVCCLNYLDTSTISQKRLKELVGKEVKKFVERYNFSNDAEEGKRCWTINYESEPFHMDILPAVYDQNGYRLLLESKLATVNDDEFYTDKAIAITDNTLENYPSIDINWNKSNPKGYYEWFIAKCKLGYIEKRLALESAGTIEKIPEEIYNTPLQKVIMLLKRHRDMMFINDNDNKPISIIITTLAAHSYSGEQDLKEALKSIVFNMERNIHKEGSLYYISNPINPTENFADKWENEPIKEHNFFQWLKQLKSDYLYLINDQPLGIKSKLDNAFGEDLITEVYSKSFSMFDKAAFSLSTIKSTILALSHVQRPTWTRSIIGNVDINCQILKKGCIKGILKSNDSIKKGVTMRFFPKVSDHIEKPYQVKWQIINSGEEARDCLRGDFYDSTSHDSRKKQYYRDETTSYKGKHIVRCFILKNEICVAQSDEFIVNII